MAVKNGEKYLREAVESILAQTFFDFEFIIIDDGSSDGTAQILDDYSDFRIVLLKNRNSIGLTRSLNLGLKKARGEYVARMDADDISLRERLNSQVEYLDSHPNVDVLGTAFTLIDDGGNNVQDIYFPNTNDLIRWQLCFINPIVHPSVLMRRSIFMKYDGYDDSINRSQDYDLWWRVSLEGKIENLEKICILLRKHSLQISNKNRDEQFEGGLEIAQKHASLAVGKTIPVDIFRHLWKNDCSSAREAMAVSIFLFDYMHLINKDAENKNNSELISQDAFKKIRRILTPFYAKPQVWMFYLNLLQQNSRLNRRDYIQVKDARV